VKREVKWALVFLALGAGLAVLEAVTGLNTAWGMGFSAGAELGLLIGSARAPPE